jgi:hypothetical protein
MATRANKRGRDTETVIKLILQNKFGKMFVHREAPFSISSKQRLDFYIYAPSGNFGVDVFYPQDIYSMASHINVKQRSYKGYNEKLYFVMANETITQKDINRVAINKINQLPNNFSLITIEILKVYINNMTKYSAVIARE